MTTISKHNQLITLINVFTVEPSRQQELLDLLDRATQIVRLEPGFISSSLHRGIDGNKVTMYAQWRSVEAYRAMRENPTPLSYFEQAAAFTEFETAVYEVVETYSPQPERRRAIGARTWVERSFVAIACRSDLQK